MRILTCSVLGLVLALAGGCGSFDEMQRTFGVVNATLGNLQGELATIRTEARDSESETLRKLGELAAELEPVAESAQGALAAGSDAVEATRNLTTDLRNGAIGVGTLLLGGGGLWGARRSGINVGRHQPPTPAA